jgi:hypothetical protein
VRLGIGFVCGHKARISEHNDHFVHWHFVHWHIERWHIEHWHIDHGPSITDSGATGGGVRRSGRQ